MSDLRFEEGSSSIVSITNSKGEKILEIEIDSRDVEKGSEFLRVLESCYLPESEVRDPNHLLKCNY